MSSQSKVDTRCRIVGDYVDVGEIPESLANSKNDVTSNRQAARTRLVATYLDSWAQDRAEMEFKVLLCDQRVVTVRGHAVKFVPNAANPQDHGSYGIVLHVGDQEHLVALFRVVEVKGVFTGELDQSRQIA
jgi:hypothetical protein